MRNVGFEEQIIPEGGGSEFWTFADTVDTPPPLLPTIKAG